MRERTLNLARAVALSALIGVPTPGRAQAIPDPRAGFTLGTGVIAVPSPPGAYCDVGGGGLEAAAGLVLRPRRPFVVEADVRSAFLVSGDCVTPLYAADTIYAASTMHHPYINSTLRVGVETPARFPLIRLTVGGGAFLAGRATPFAVFDAAWSTRGTRARLFFEAERTIRRVTGVEELYDLATHRPDVTRPVTVRATTDSFRIGMEIPLGQRSLAKSLEEPRAESGTSEPAARSERRDAVGVFTEERVI